MEIIIGIVIFACGMVAFLWALGILLAYEKGKTDV